MLCMFNFVVVDGQGLQTRDGGPMLSAESGSCSALRMHGAAAAFVFQLNADKHATATLLPPSLCHCDLQFTPSCTSGRVTS